MRKLVAIAVALTALTAPTMLTTPAYASAEDDALSVCKIQWKRNGGGSMSNFQVSGGGDRWTVVAFGMHSGRENVRSTCKVHNGRVTNIAWG